MRLAVAMSIALLAVSIPVSLVGAVTYGTTVLAPSKKYPSVVSVWLDKSKSGDPEESAFICTATLIESNVALTAAHCIQGLKGNWYVAVGADSLGQGRFIPVDAVWYSGRYSAKRIANDIGLLHLQTSAGLREYASVSKVNKLTSRSRLQIVGWGLDQNGDLSGDLNQIKVTLDTQGARKAWGAEFNEQTTIAAGRYIKAEGLYGGACNGDSGGPLFLAGTVAIVGTVSYGLKECDAYTPTVFARVSYYSNDISAGLKLIKKKARESSIGPVVETLPPATTPAKPPTTTPAKPPTTTPAKPPATTPATTPAKPPATTPLAPERVLGTVSNTAVSLTWTGRVIRGGERTTDWVVQYSTNSGSTWTTFSDGVSIETAATVTGLTNGKSYIFRVAAKNSIGLGSYSASSGEMIPNACPTGGTCYVGTTGPGGGIVFYVASTAFTSTGSSCATNCLYLEAAPQSWSNGGYACGTTGLETVDPVCNWSGNTDTAIGVTAQGTSIGTGYSNTTAIIAQGSGGSTPNMAATSARAYAGLGKTDWFLPSKDELNELCKYAMMQTTGNAATICNEGGTPGSGPRIAGFSRGSYWSSSEYVSNNAWYSNFPPPHQFINAKGLFGYVRPVRAF